MGRLFSFSLCLFFFFFYICLKNYTDLSSVSQYQQYKLCKRDRQQMPLLFVPSLDGVGILKCIMFPSSKSICSTHWFSAGPEPCGGCGQHEIAEKV